ncbi:hypothetical protein ACWGIT_20190 [Streptomyces cyaneofuscatus]
MTYTSSARQADQAPRPAWTRGAEYLPGGPETSAVNGAANDSNVVPITAAHTARKGASRHADTSLPSPETLAKGKKSTPTAGKVRADALRMLGCVRIATVRQMASVISACLQRSIERLPSSESERWQGDRDTGPLACVSASDG